ncbi:protein JASON-like [Rutidosis leptorrhynchoides]|uniref:protein JASON-like n=1 Tax=Rutidosis leptorrhynchoides TaxID=125765 RepID=UPI003A98E812
MGCFFGCFRVNDNRRTSVHLLSQPISSNHKVPVEAVARNPLSSLLLLESEEGDQLSQKERKCGSLGSDAPDVDFNELEAEAKFLKACGTLPQTPAEIRNNEKLANMESGYGDRESSTSRSWLQNDSIEKVKLEKLLDQKLSPVKLTEEWENESDYSSHSPDSCLTGQNSERTYCSSGVRRNVETSHAHADVTQNPIPSSTPHVLSTQCRNKSVPFDCKFDPSSFSASNASSIVTCEQKNPSGEYTISKPSPYPTPLELTNDIQTPGTFFPTGKSPRIRSQYVHPGLNPVENADQLKKLVANSFGSDDYDYSAQLKEQLEERTNTAEKQLTVDTSLSSWLPPKRAHQGRNNRSFIGKTVGDRPIIGMVAAHWNTDETETVSSQSKWWDGNGIPNSTNKYKEDQKVSWHATPFEERLEKALSEDKLTGDRKQFGKVSLPPPIDC